jgi:histidyl-tRNA synthetase
VGGGGRYDALVSLIGGAQVPASGFALEAGSLASLLAAEVSERRIITVALEARDGASLASAFRLASALRMQGLAVQVAGEPPQGAPVVKTADEEYVLVEPAGRKSRLASVEAVAEALRECGPD